MPKKSLLHISWHLLPNSLPAQSCLGHSPWPEESREAGHRDRVHRSPGLPTCASRSITTGFLEIQQGPEARYSRAQGTPLCVKPVREWWVGGKEKAGEQPGAVREGHRSQVL